LGASVAGIVNFESGGWGFSDRVHAMVAAFRPSLPSSPVSISFSTNSSSVDACADTRN
jgi:hypothetical protein